MAEFRTVHSKMYHDKWYCEQPIDGKLLFVYLFTNASASVAGIYQLPVKFIAFETGIEPERVAVLLNDFQQAGKIEWEEPVIWVKKMRDYQATKSPQVATRIAKDFDEIPFSPIKVKYGVHYGVYPIDTVYRAPDTLSTPVSESKSDTDTDTDTDTEREGAASPPPPPAITTPTKHTRQPKPPKQSKPEKTPAVLVYHAAAKLWPNDLQEAAINRVVQDLAKWQLVVDTWRMRGVKPTNVECLIDWYTTGIPDAKLARNGGNHASNQRNAQQNWTGSAKPVDPARPKIRPFGS